MDDHSHPDELLHADQQQAEVVGPQQRSGREDVRRPVDPARVADRTQLRPQRKQAEQRHERVHPGLLRVPDQQRRGGAEGGGDQARATVVQLPAEQVERRDNERTGDQRREPDGHLAVAERAHGQPEGDVVQRRMAIPELQVLEHVVEAEVRLVDADRLVEPDARVARQAAAPARRASRPPARPEPRSASCRARRAWAAGRGARTARPPALRGAVATSSANSLRPAP